MPLPAAGPAGRVFLVSAARTPIGKFGGSLAEIPATTLGGIAIRAAVERAGVPLDAIDDVFMGMVLQAGTGQAQARVAALKAGLPETTSATTINRVCGSGMKAIMLAASELKAGADQDAFALESHRRAIAAIDGGRFDDEIVPVPIRRGKEETLFTTDEAPRRDTTPEALARLKPPFALPAHEGGA